MFIRFRRNKHKGNSALSKVSKIVLSTLLVICILVGGLLLTANNWYKNNLKPLDPNSSLVLDFKVEPGTSAASIANNLQSEGIIRSATAFGWYVRLNDQRANLKSGSYKLSPSQSVETLVNELSKGRDETRSFTVLPGKRLDEIKQQFIDEGYSAEEVEAGFDPDLYSTHGIANYKPASASLEGYIFPETISINDEMSVKQILTTFLDEFYAQITPDLVASFKNQGLSVHQAVTMASIVEKEVSNQQDKPIVAQVFLKRLKQGIALGSDVTFFYAAAITGQRALPSLDHPYNTRIYTGLPPGPISNMSLTTLQAVANPASTDYLFFVAGDDGKTYFSYTQAEHENYARLYCIEGCKL